MEQASPTVVVHRRGEQGFAREVHSGVDAVIPLPEVDAELPLAGIYEDVEFAPDAE